MPTAQWNVRNRIHKMATRLRYPPPLYKKVGGINAVVTRGDTGTYGAPGSKDDHGMLTATYARRWGVGSGR